jgi:hypothetical protein
MVEFDKNLSLLKIRNNYTVVEETHESNEIAMADEETRNSLEGVTYVRFYKDEGHNDAFGYWQNGGLRVQLRHGDGETPVKDLPSISYSAEGLMAGKTEITAEMLQRILELDALSKFSTESVLLARDLTFTTPFGRYGSTDSATAEALAATGQYTIPAKKPGATDNMTLHELLISAFATDTMPKITSPNLSVALSGFTEHSHEVGTTVTINYRFNTTAGSYEFGPETGVTWRDFKANLTGDVSAGVPFTGTALTSREGSFTIKILDGTSLSFTGSATHDGAINTPNSALVTGGYPAGIIAALTSPKIINITDTFTGYRNVFFGTDTQSTDLSGTQIRSNLQNKFEAVATEGSYVWQTAGWDNGGPDITRLVFAIPSTYVLDELTNGKSTIASSIKGTIPTPVVTKVPGASEDTEMDYNVYYFYFANPLKAATYYVKIKTA